MHFERAGKVFKVRAYRGYNAEKRTSVMKYLGTVDAYTFAVSDTLRAAMTEAEAAELAEWIKKQQTEKQQDSNAFTIRYAPTGLRHLATLVADETNPLPDDYAGIYEPLDQLKKALASRGVKRPAKAKPEPKPHPGQGDLLAGVAPAAKPGKSTTKPKATAKPTPKAPTTKPTRKAAATAKPGKPEAKASHIKEK